MSTLFATNHQPDHILRMQMTRVQHGVPRQRGTRIKSRDANRMLKIMSHLPVHIMHVKHFCAAEKLGDGDMTMLIYYQISTRKEGPTIGWAKVFSS